MRLLQWILPLMIGFVITAPLDAADNVKAKTDTAAAEVKDKTAAAKTITATAARKPVEIGKTGKTGKPFIEQLDQEEQRRLMKLYQDNPAAYYAELDKIIGLLRKEEAELNQKLGDAVTAYRAATDPEDKKKKLETVKTLTRQQFFFRLNETERRIKESEKRLDQLRKLYDARKKSADAIIDKRIQYLISDPSQRW